MQARTKMICTIGPASESRENLEALIDAGMNVARLNFSHGSYDEHGARIKLLQQIREEKGKPVAIMLDTKGPEIRVGELKGDVLEMKEGSLFDLVEKSSKESEIPINPPIVLEILKENDRVLFDDGYIETVVTQASKTCVTVKVLNSGTLKSKKGVNIPSRQLNIPFLTKKDIEDIEFGCRMGVDAIAASFVCKAIDIIEMKRLCERMGEPDMPIISKIESDLGVRNFDAILAASDGIMVARGDLGVEMPPSQVPKLQKRMIRKCLKNAKPVVIATQMLESMIQNPRPTRAEVSDVANAIYDGASCVMLSGESAAGKYPIEAAKMMKLIARETESDIDYEELFYQKMQKGPRSIAASTAAAIVKTAYSIGAKGLFTYAASGSSVRLLARCLPRMPILALTADKKVYYRMAFNWNTIPLMGPKCTSPGQLFENICNLALQRKVLHFGDLTVMASGYPFGRIGATNTMMIHYVGDVILRGEKGLGKNISAPVEPIFIPTGKISSKGKIIVINRCDSSYDELLKQAEGVILDESEEDKESLRYALDCAKKWHLSLVTGAEGAMKVLEPKQIVTLEPKNALIYQGDVFEKL